MLLLNNINKENDAPFHIDCESKLKNYLFKNLIQEFYNKSSLSAKSCLNDNAVSRSTMQNYQNRICTFYKFLTLEHLKIEPLFFIFINLFSF